MKTGFFAGRFNPFHQGHLYSILYASNLVDKLYVIMTASEKRDRAECEKAGIKYADGAVRLSWIYAALKDIPNIQIAKIDDTSASAEDYDWRKGGEDVHAIISEPIHFIFGSEPSQTPYLRILYPEAQYIIIDEERKTVPVSATKIRENIFANWEYLPPETRQFYVKKILITGTELTGKSTLAIKLAKFFNTNCVGETVDFNDSAPDHFAAQKEAQKTARKLLFVDGDAIAARRYLGGTSPFIEGIIREQRYDVILYLKPADKCSGMEEHEQYDTMLLSEYQKYGCGKLVQLEGSYHDRFMGALHHLFAMGFTCKDYNANSALSMY